MKQKYTTDPFTGYPNGPARCQETAPDDPDAQCEGREDHEGRHHAVLDFGRKRYEW